MASQPVAYDINAKYPGMRFREYLQYRRAALADGRLEYTFNATEPLAQQLLGFILSRKVKSITCGNKHVAQVPSLPDVPGLTATNGVGSLSLGNLPYEMRAEIYGAYIGVWNEARMIEVKVDCKSEYIKSYQNPDNSIVAAEIALSFLLSGSSATEDKKIDVLINTCQESRAYCKERYPEYLQISNERPKIYFHPDIDIIFMSDVSLFNLSLIVLEGKASELHGWNKIKILAVQSPQIGRMGLHGLLMTVLTRAEVLVSGIYWDFPTPGRQNSTHGYSEFDNCWAKPKKIIIDAYRQNLPNLSQSRQNVAHKQESRIGRAFDSYHTEDPAFSSVWKHVVKESHISKILAIHARTL